MVCPSCYGPSRITRTLDTGTEVTRMHECLDVSCDTIWTTDQKLRSGSLRKNRRAIRRQGTATYGISGGTAPPTTVPNLPAAANSAGGVGGGLSSALIPVPSSLSDPSLQSASGGSAPARETIYPVEFEAAWESTAKTGSKFKAFEAWKRQGKPAAVVLAASWAQWAQLEGWQRGFVPHVVTWLNGKCWEQRPAEVVRNALPEKAQRSREALQQVLNERKAVTG